MALNTDHPRLGCGRDLDEFWATIDEPPSDHELSCPDCQSARNSLYHLAAVTQSLRERDRTEPALQPGQRVKEAVMMVARAEIRRGRTTPLITNELGRIEISDQALTALVRFAASTVPGVRARRCTISPSLEAAQADQEGLGTGVTTVTLDLHVAVSSKVRIPETLRIIRERVGTVVTAQTSIITERINVTVEDLYDL